MERERDLAANPPCINSVPKTIAADRSPPPLSHLVIFSKGEFESDTHSGGELGKAGIMWLGARSHAEAIKTTSNYLLAAGKSK